MAIDRRTFLKLGLTTLSLGPARLLAGIGHTRLLSCRTDLQGHHFVTMLDENGRIIMDIPLPARGHGIAVDSSNKLAAVFARRPGDFVWIIDLTNHKVTNRVTAEEGQHFYGHGLFTTDGRHLLCSENAYETGEGRIGIYDPAMGYKRTGELSSQGIGPHEIKLLSDSRTLVVANGGIRTHPDLPRIKSNLQTMEPNLAYIDLQNGQLLQKYEPPSKWHQLSIRHIDVAADDTVAIAMQFQGRPQNQPPLIGIHKHGESMKLLMAPDEVQRRMRNYCGSVTFNSEGSHFAVSSPRGGLVTFWSRRGEYLGLHQQQDACGIGRTSDSLIISDGSGRLVLTDQPGARHEIGTTQDSRWDNHLTSL
ncbi:MAG: DUF1513 domain-containing protein [Sedimenticola sp.]